MLDKQMQKKSSVKGRVWLYSSLLATVAVIGMNGGRVAADTVQSTEVQTTTSTQQLEQENLVTSTTAEETTEKEEAEAASQTEPTTTESAPEAKNTSWQLNPSTPEAQDAQLSQLGTVEGETGVYQGLIVDATAAGAKFAPRQTDTQVNAGTVISLPIATHPYGAEIDVELAGGTTSIETNLGTNVTGSKSVTVAVSANEGLAYVNLKFLQNSYLTKLALRYLEAPQTYPGVPDSVQAEANSWDFSTGERPQSQGNHTESYQGIKIDTRAAGSKFAPRTGDTQINAATVLYIPLAANQHGAKVAFTLSGGTASLHTDQDSLTNFSGTGVLSLSASESPRYLAVTFDQTSYLKTIAVEYTAAPVSFPGLPDDVEASDTVWDLTEAGGSRPLAQADNSQTYQGIKIDARQGKFSPRAQDTQINAGTILYIPVAADAQGATFSIAGNNYNNLSVRLDGQEIAFGTDIQLQPNEKGYLALEFSSETGLGSAYVTAISLDYASDNRETTHTVTVGVNGQYQSIQAALDANTSSLKDRLILEIEPGDYHEKVTVKQAGVTFRNADRTGAKKVVIRSAYYSSNRFDANGVFQPKDAYDLGTDLSATVLVMASATGFSAYGITFQNDYNITEHVGEGEQTPAVAFNSKADKVNIQDSAFIGRQDTLYLQGVGNRVLIENSYIEGTVDFIFGNADAYIKNSHIFMAYYPGRKSGYFTAPNTSKGYVGLVFDNCLFEVSDLYPATATLSLGRPWQTEIATQTVRNPDGTTSLIGYDATSKNPAYTHISSATTLINSKISDRIFTNRWSSWTRKDKSGQQIDVTYHPDVRFREFNSRDLAGQLLSVKPLPLGLMEIGDAEGYKNQVLDQMRMGEGFGHWEIQSLTQGQGYIQVHYFDETNGQLLASQDLRGDYGSVVDYQTSSAIKSYEELGYTLVGDGYPTQGVVFSRFNKGQIYQVRLKHGQETQDEARTITQTIHYRFEDGSQAFDSKVTSLTFSRQVMKDLVTKEVTYSPWVAIDGTTFERTTPPILQGYTPNPKRTERRNQITADSPNEELTVTYVGNKVTGRVVYIDDTSGKTLANHKLSGKFGSKSDYLTAPSIQKYLEKGYELVSDQYPTDGLVFQELTENRYEVHLKHRLLLSEESKTVTRTIRYVNEKGRSLASDHVSTLTFTRSVSKDLVTKKVVYGEWLSPTGDQFEAVVSPDIVGFTTKQKEVASVANARLLKSDLKVTVTYEANDEKALVIFIDDNTGQIVLERTLIGKSGDKSSYQLSTDLKRFKKQGYVLVSSHYPSNGQVFSQPGVVRSYEVHLKHGTLTVTAAKPGKPGQALYSGSQATWPAGSDRQSLTKTVTRTIDYLDQTGKKLAKSTVETLTFHRELVIDSVTGQIVATTAWVPAKGNKGFKSVSVPKIKGYAPEIQRVQAVESVTADSSDIHHIVRYTVLPKQEKKKK